MVLFDFLFGSKPANKTAAAAATPPRIIYPADAAAPVSPISRPATTAARPPSSVASTTLSQVQLGPPVDSSFFSERSIKQASIFFGGAGFLAMSILLSRRAVARHIRKSRIQFYQPNHFSQAAKESQIAQAAAGREPLVALEALNLATLNTVSFFIMLFGGAAWALDVSSLDDLRHKARASLYGAAGATDEEAEREVAAWVYKVMGTQGLEDEKQQQPQPESSDVDKKP